MNLTPLDVRRKQFDKGFRGYDPTEVDLFLKQVAQRLEEVQEEARRAEERVRETEAKLVHYEKVELALQEALESARETVKRTEASAEEKARLLVQDAELRAEKILRDAERERHGLRQDLIRLSSRQAEVAARLRGFLLSELEVLAQFQGDDPVGFIKLQPAGGAGALPPSPARLEAPIESEEAYEPESYEAEAYGTESYEAEPHEPAPTPFEPAPEAPTFQTPEPEPFVPEPETPSFDAAPAEPAAAPEPAPADVPTYAEPPPPPAPAPPQAPVTPINAPLELSEGDEVPGEHRIEHGIPLTGAYDAAPETPSAPSTADPSPSGPPPSEPPSTPAVTGGWDLRSLVTGEERSVAASDEERERIRRILDDLD